MPPSLRTIDKVVPAKAGAVQRLIGTVDVDGKGTEHVLEECDPCILLDQGTIPKNAFPPFGRHPHYGHSVVTILMNGKMTSWDSATQEMATITGPASYWVDAGTGVFHEEQSVIADESDSNQHVSLFQLWIGVTEEDRQKPPSLSYDTELPVFEEISGEFKEGESKKQKDIIAKICHYVGPSTKIATPRPLTVCHVHQYANTKYTLPLDPKHTGFLVNLSGATWLDPKSQPASFAGTTPTAVNDVLVLSNCQGTALEITTDDGPADYLVCVGEPHQSPWAKKLVASGAIIAESADKAREIASNVEHYSKKGKETGVFAPFGK